MKLGLLFAAVVVAAESAQEFGHHHHGHHSHHLRTHAGHQGLISQHHHSHSLAKNYYGDPRCPCIGFDNIQGTTLIKLAEGFTTPYPADTGSSCQAWDDGRYPKACQEGGEPGLGQDWCGQPWCYVDACNCHLDVLPKKSGYLPDAMFQGQELFYSYLTCGGKDFFTENVPDWGSPGCRCVGIHNIPGHMTYGIGDGKVAEYPADTGGSCAAWDMGHHADCVGDNPPKWCKEQWCYVDPCSCGLTGKDSPKVTSYLPDANYNGRKIFYSYETCSGTDFFTIDNDQACVNQRTKKDCAALGDKCGWTGKHCLGKELTDPDLCPPTDEAKNELESKKEDEPEHKSAALHGAAGVSTLMLLLIGGARA